MTIAGILLAALLSADPSAPAESADETREAVDGWVKQLEAPSLAERSRAERELLDLGPRILPLLPPSELVRGAAARDAVQRIRIRLQQRLARDSVRPSRVTVSGEYDLDRLLKEIARQTDNAIQLSADVPSSARGLSFWSFDSLTFWEAIAAVCRATDLVPTSKPETEALILDAKKPNQRTPAVCTAGVLRAELTEALCRPVEGDPKRLLLRLRGDLMFEPRLRPLFVHFGAGDFSAQDPDGNPFAVWNPQARYELPMAGASRRTQLIWDFVAPADAAPKTLSLKGRLLVQLAAAAEAIRFDRLTTNREVLRRRGGVSVRLHQAEFPNAGTSNTARVKITVSYEAGGPAFESHRTWVYHNAAWIEDGERRIPFTDFDALLKGDGNVQLEYRFQGLPEPQQLQFVYEAPTLILDVPFDIEYSDVEIER